MVPAGCNILYHIKKKKKAKTVSMISSILQIHLKINKAVAATSSTVKKCVIAKYF